MASALRLCFSLIVFSILVFRAEMTALPFRGVNQAVAEFGKVGDPFNSGYSYPATKSIDYFVSKGMNTFRFPFLWERVQKSLNGPLDTTEMGRMDSFINYVTKTKNSFLLLDPHNYARYNGQVIGQPGSGVTVDHFKDFWTKLANYYKNNNKIIFGIMNEPNTMSSELWRDNCQAAINAIRATGATNMIFVPGNAWTGAHSWTQNYYGTPNSQVMGSITDPGNNFAFELHQYLDSDFSGTRDSCSSADVGANALREVTAWLRQRGQKGFLGEFGGGRNDLCYQALDNMLTYMEANSDVWIGWTYWAAGPWWGNYIFTLEPTNEYQTDQPQMAPLSKHLSSQVVVTTGQVTTGRVTTGQVTTGRVTAGQITTGQVTTGQITTGQVTTGQVTTGQQGNFVEISVGGAIGLAFSPSYVEISVGDTVHWTIDGYHNIAQSKSAGDVIYMPGGFRSGDAGTLTEWSMTFTTPGIFYYICEPHADAGMRASILVKSASSGSTTGSVTTGKISSGTTGMPSESVIFTAALDRTIPIMGSFDVIVAYNALANRDLVVEVLNRTTSFVHAFGISPVGTGKGIVTVGVNITTPFTDGADYILKAKLIDSGVYASNPTSQPYSWYQVTVTAGTPHSSAASLLFNVFTILALIGFVLIL